MMKSASDATDWNLRIAKRNNGLGYHMPHVGRVSLIVAEVTECAEGLESRDQARDMSELFTSTVQQRRAKYLVGTSRVIFEATEDCDSYSALFDTYVLGKETMMSTCSTLLPFDPVLPKCLVSHVNSSTPKLFLPLADVAIPIMISFGGDTLLGHVEPHFLLRTQIPLRPWRIARRGDSLLRVMAVPLSCGSNYERIMVQCTSTLTCISRFQPEDASGVYCPLLTVVASKRVSVSLG